MMALLLVLLLSIESFAAVVSDNDESAFITKAEFDSLKNNFQNQIDQYNTSIDSKIDGAIASYLAGIKVEKMTDLPSLVEKYKDIYWCNDFSLFAKKGTWTAKNTRTSADAAVVQPDYTNREGYSFYMQNRGARIIFHNHNLWGAFIMPFRMAFESDNTGATRTSHRQASEVGMHILCLNVDDKETIRLDDPLRQHDRVFYLWCRFGMDAWGSGASDPFGVMQGIKIADYPDRNYRMTVEPMDPDANAHIRFKKSDFTNSNNDYCTGTEDTDSGTSITFDDTHTINIKNKTFYIDVEKGDTIWMNIDPITLGQHIRITDLSVTLVTE